MVKQFIASLREHDPTPLVRGVARSLAAGLMLLFALVLYSPGLGDSWFVYGTDTTSHDYIMHLYGWVNSIGERGELPLWNPYLFSGFPMIGSAALCPFYPSQWLYAIFPFNTGFTLQYVLAVAIGGIGAAWWMRCLGHRRSICMWAGFAYMVSGHFLTLTHAGHLQKMIALGWTPVALGATIQLVQLGRGGVRHSRRYKAAALLGLALAMQILASHPQVFYATAAACVLQLVGMALTSVRWRAMILGQAGDSESPAKRLRPVGRAIGMSILALVVCAVISAVQLFPSYEMGEHSNRAEGVTFAEAVETSYPPLELLEYAVPRVFGDSVRGTTIPYFGDWGERIVSDYLGIPLLFLALTGLLGSRRRYRWFLLILFLTGTIVGLGNYTPVYWLLYHTLPGFDGFRSPGTFMFLSNCALIALAAFGLDYLVSLAQTVNDQGWGSSFSDSETEVEPVPEPPPSRFANATVDDTQPFHTDAVEYSGTDTPPYGMPSVEHDQFDDDYGYAYHYAPPQGRVSSSNFTWDNENIPWLGRPPVLVFLAALAVTALIAAIIALAENWDVDLKIATDEELLSYHTYSRVAGVAIATMCLLAAILLLRLRTWIGGVAIGIVALAFPLFHNNHFLRYEPLNPFMAHLTRQPGLMHLSKTAPQPARLVEQNAMKNEAMLYSVSSAAGYHPIMSGNYSAVANSLGIYSDSLASLFTINYARTTSEEQPPGGTWVPYGDEPAQARNSYLWQRAQLVPYTRNLASLIAYDTEEISLTSASLSSIIGEIQTTGGGAPPAYTARVSHRDMRRFRLSEGRQMAEAQLQRWMPHEVRLRVRAAVNEERGSALLPVSDPYFPGWKAETSEGQPLPVIAVNGVQRGAVLPEGEFNIRFKYSPYSFRLGLFISLVSATMLVSFGIGTISRRMIKGRKKVKKVIKRAQTGRQSSLDAPAEKAAEL